MKITHINNFQQISKMLATRESESFQYADGCTRAAVALIISQSPDNLEILFIQRASDDHDPWSGHIAFPGGKLEAGETVRQAALRETLEETGIDLGEGTYLGRLSDIVGANLPVWVSCCAYGIDRNSCVTSLSDEVNDLFWITLADLRDKARHLLADVAFGERKMKVPAISLPFDDKPVLWGITYRLLIQFIELLENFDCEDADSVQCITIPELIKLDEVE